MAVRRVDRLNSLLREVISDVIKRHVRNQNLHELIAITRVDISRDLHYAKVYVSVIGDDETQKKSIEALESAAGYVGVLASKEVRMRFFPHLRFLLDDSAEKHMRIDSLLKEIAQERQERQET